MKLKVLDVEDIEALFETIAHSFQIQFRQEDIAALQTFGDLCDLIDRKILLRDVDDCTTQQAFNKLRTAMVDQLFNAKPLDWGAPCSRRPDPNVVSRLRATLIMPSR